MFSRLRGDFPILETRVGEDKDLLDGKEEQPFLRVEGRAREGTRSMSVLYEQFLARLRAELPMARITASPAASYTAIASSESTRTCRHGSSARVGMICTARLRSPWTKLARRFACRANSWSAQRRSRSTCRSPVASTAIAMT